MASYDRTDHSFDEIVQGEQTHARPAELRLRVGTWCGSHAEQPHRGAEVEEDPP